MNTVDGLKQRYQEVQERVAAAAARSGRAAGDVLVVAVSKYTGLDDIRELIDLGHRDFGESQVQQLLQRVAMIQEFVSRKAGPGSRGGGGGGGGVATGSGGSAGGVGVGGKAAGVDIRWHMIGHLQRNKVRKALEAVRLIHSVDSLRVAEEVQLGAVRMERVVDVLVQVNMAGESSKHGLPPAAVPHVIDSVGTMANVRVRGLMVMAPYSDRAEDSRPVFARTRELYEDLLRAGVVGSWFNLLSMGMSGDYEVAVEEGATVVRVGSVLFGPPGPTPPGAGPTSAAGPEPADPY